MTKLLEEAIATVFQLPETEQDAIATLIIEKLASKKPAPVIIPKTEIEAIERSYTLREKTEVIQFLENHPFLVPVLLEAPEKIRYYFPDEELFIQVDYDPENINYVQLVLSILTKITPDDAVDRLNKLDKNWSLSLSYQVREKFFTILEYSDDF